MISQKFQSFSAAMRKEKGTAVTVEDLQEAFYAGFSWGLTTQPAEREQAVAEADAFAAKMVAKYGGRG